jgi:soluble lytic murein transglycosylase-like protein
MRKAKMGVAWSAALIMALAAPAWVTHEPRADRESVARPGIASLLDEVETLTDSIEAGMRRLEDVYASQFEPLIDSLMLLRNDRTLATRIALALVREGEKTGIDPRLLLAVMKVENPWLDLEIESFMGAVGLMQVMPFHAGNWGCGSADLTDLDSNICHGARILASALARTNGDIAQALLRYNGCVRGTNTPDCHNYPSWVLRQPGMAWLESTQIMAQAQQ